MTDFSLPRIADLGLASIDLPAYFEIPNDLSSNPDRRDFPRPINVYGAKCWHRFPARFLRSPAAIVPPRRGFEIQSNAEEQLSGKSWHLARETGPSRIFRLLIVEADVGGLEKRLDILLSR